MNISARSLGGKREADRFAKMTDWERAFADRVLLAVTAAFIEIWKRNKLCVGLLKWELGVKVTSSCSILLSDFEKGLVSVTDAAS